MMEKLELISVYEKRYTIIENQSKLEEFLGISRSKENQAEVKGLIFTFVLKEK